MSFLRDVLAVLRKWALDGGTLEIVEIALAAAIIYVVALWIVRAGKKRFLGRNTIFDVLLAFILGSVLSRAINGDAPLGATAVAGFVLIGMHFVLGNWAESSHKMGVLIKGRPEQVMQDGEMERQAMKEHHITRRDLEEAARMAGLTGLEEVDAAHFERNGKISILPKRRVQIVDVQVQDNVQTVRIAVQF